MYTQNYNQDPTQARLNALYLQLCSQTTSGGTLTLSDSCFTATNASGQQVAQLCLTGWSFPSQNASMINLDLLPGDSALLFDNQLTNYIATPLPAAKSYVRGILITVVYPNLDANGVVVDPSLYTCKLTISNLQDNQVAPFNSAGPAVNVVSAPTTQFPGFPNVASTITLTGQVAGTGGATILTYKWTKVSGPTGDFSGIYTPNASSTKIINLIPGQYVFQLVVTDSNNLTTTSKVTVNVANPSDTPPTVAAGSNQIITLAQAQTGPVTITGTATPNGGASIVTTQWQQTGGPNAATLTMPTQLSTTITNLNNAGLYTFELDVTDSNGFISSSTVTITITDLQTFSVPLNSFYAHFCNPVTTDATQLLDSLTITNVSATMPICVQAMLISDASQPSSASGNSLNNNCNC